MRALILGTAMTAICWSVPAAAAVCDVVWRDGARGRDVPVRVRLPEGAGKVPVVLFSHGLGGSLAAGTSFAERWAAAGIATIHIQHPGSDEAVWRGSANAAAVAAALKPAANADQLVARIADVSFVLDEMARRPRAGACDLTRLDPARVGIAGHSFGAQTVQAVAGQSFGARRPADARIRAAVALSPAARGPVAGDAASFGSIRIPFLSVTGTNDAVAIMNDVSPADRLRPYAGMAPGDKYLAVFKDADHQVFGGSRIRRPADRSDARVRDATATLTTAFFRAYLTDDTAARTALRAGRTPPGVIAAGDRFEHK